MIVKRGFSNRYKRELQAIRLQPECKGNSSTGDKRPIIARSF